MKNTQKHAVPDHLEGPESDFYAAMMGEYGIDDAGGLALLTAACESRGRARRCREAIDRDGELTAEGKTHPLLLCERDSRKAFVQTLNLMGLDIEPAGAVGRPTGQTVRRVK